MHRRTGIAFLRKVEHAVTPNKTQSYRRHATFGPRHGYCRLSAVAGAAATYIAGYKSPRTPCSSPLPPPPPSPPGRLINACASREHHCAFHERPPTWNSCFDRSPHAAQGYALKGQRRSDFALVVIDRKDRWTRGAPRAVSELEGSQLGRRCSSSSVNGRWRKSSLLESFHVFSLPALIPCGNETRRFRRIIKRFAWNFINVT